MYTRRALEKIIQSVLTDLEQNGWGPTKAVLFGSYSKGNPHRYSDIDLAVWAKKFTGFRFDDRNAVRLVMKPYPDVQLHPFAEYDDENTNPFISEIFKHGKLVYQAGHPVQSAI